jgi:hypothetical protein
MQNSGSTNHPFLLAMQSDYSLIVYDSAFVWIWSSQTWSPPPVNCYLKIRDDGNLVIYKSDGSIVWQTTSKHLMVKS